MPEKRLLWKNCDRIVIQELNRLWRLLVSMELDRRTNIRVDLGVVKLSNLFAPKQYSMCEVITKVIACNTCIVPANDGVHCIAKHPEISMLERRSETYTFTAALVKRKSEGLRINNIMRIGPSDNKTFETKHEHDYQTWKTGNIRKK
jgi:hypothetical protein